MLKRARGDDEGLLRARADPGDCCFVADVALPLQIHPDKELSEKLHKENPKQFA